MMIRRGNRRLFELLRDVINANFPAWKVDRMPMDQPEWNIMGESFARNKK